MERTIKQRKQRLIGATVLLLCLALLFTGMAIWQSGAFASADETARQTISVSNVTTNRGQEFDLDVSVADNEQGLLAMRLLVTYDNTALRLVGVTPKNPEGGNNWIGNFNAAGADSNGGYASYGGETKPFVLLWINSSKLLGSGTVATLTFATLPGAEVGEYAVTVTPDRNNTLLTMNQKCSPAVSGGVVTMLPGVYSVELLSEDGARYAFKEDNDAVVTIAGALGDKPLPTKEATSKYGYEFRGWKETNDSTSDHRVYAPIFTAVPVSYEITFRQGILKEGENEISYTDPLIASYLGDDYLYDTEKVSIPYSSIVVFDDYKPETDYDVHPDYTFYGWYEDDDCTQAVSFATMPDRDVTLYGVYRFNADEDDVTATKLAVETSVEGKTVFATVSVTENYGFNSLRFALDYDVDKLDFAGFLYESTTALYAELAPVFPAINETITAGGSVKDAWQTVADGETIAGKSFFFQNADGNAYSSDAVSATGKLITFRFFVKDSVPTGRISVGLSIGEKDVTRFIGDGSVWYAHTVVTSGDFSVLRVAAPTETTLTYVYSGNEQTYLFGDVGDSDRYVVAVGSDKRTAAGSQDVSVALKAVANTVITWTDGTTADRVYPFEIEIRSVEKPAESAESYFYNGNEQTYPIAASVWYTVQSGTDKRTTAGSQYVVISLNDDENTQWSGGTTGSLSYSFVIRKLLVAKPTASALSYAYTGEEQTYTFANEGDHLWYTIEVGTNKRTAVGSQTVTVSLKDAENTAWTDEMTEDLFFTFTIAKRSVAKPTASSTEYVYTGEEQTYSFSEVGDALWYTVQSGTDKRTAAGSQTVTVSLSDPENSHWEGGDSTADLTFVFTVGKKALPTPVVNSKTYTGFPQVADVIVEAGAPYEVTRNDGGVSIGSYPVEFTFTESNYDNYRWADSVTDTVSALFRIVPLANEWRITPYVANKVYDGEPASTSAATALYGEVTVTYRAQNATDADYTAVAPVTAGEYYAKFYVPATDDVDEMTEIISFEIYKVRLTAPTASVKAYVYTGGEQHYEFANAGDTEQYEVAGATRTNAGVQTVTASIKDKTNYIWKDGGASDKVFTFTIAKKELTAPTASVKNYVYNGMEQTYEFGNAGDTERYVVENGTRTNAGAQTVTVGIADKENYVWVGGSDEDLIFLFTIAKKRLTVPVPADRSYIYNGEEQTFEFSVAGDTEQYSVIGRTRTEVGTQSVICSLCDKTNYEWADGSTSDDKRYLFSVNRSSLIGETGGADPVSVTVSSGRGFSSDCELSVVRSLPDITALLEYIEAADKVGALGVLTPQEAAALVAGKCILDSLSLTLLEYGLPIEGSGDYYIDVTLSAERSGLVVLRIAEDAVEVFDPISVGAKGISFCSDKLGAIILLADHAFDRKIAADRYLKSGATCEEPAVYYKSCACGMSSEGRTGETFTLGAALGHDLDFGAIVWKWSADHRSATATLVCKRDESHRIVFLAEVAVSGRTSPTKDASGYIDRVANIVYDGVIYSTTDREFLPSDGHLYTESPVWVWKGVGSTYRAQAVFTCDCGESILTKEATVTFAATAVKVIFTAEVYFNGLVFRDLKEIDRPSVIFDFDDGITAEVSRLLLPGEFVTFEEAPLRVDHEFLGWRDEKGALVVKDESGAFSEYRIGLERVVFHAEWKSFATVNILVRDDAGAPVASAAITLYDDGEVGSSAITSTDGVAITRVPFGNYKLVVSYPYSSAGTVTTTVGVDVEREETAISLILPRKNLHTVLDGAGSVEGLDGAISEEEKAAIGDGTTGGSVNEIVITQKRVSTVAEFIKDELVGQLRREERGSEGRFIDFYDVTLFKTTTARNASGASFVRQENVKVAAGFQTNVFPLGAALRAEIARVGGNAENVFVYVRHTYENGVTVISRLPKVSEAEGVNAERACFYIKSVAGEEYLAIRQKEYSVVAVGVSPDPVRLSNEITELTVADIVFGEELGVIEGSAKYGINTVRFTFSAEEHGVYTTSVPTAAGKYYLKAYIPATAEYEEAEKIVSFVIRKKLVARPQADPTAYVYSGEAQTYVVAENAAYSVMGNVRTDAGRYVVTLSLVDPVNTAWSDGLTDDIFYEFVIAKKKLGDLPTVSFEDRTYNFNGKRRCIEINGDLPEGVTVSYVGNGEYEIGRYVVTAIFSVENPNYEAGEPITAVLEIRLNYVPVVILIAIVLLILVAVIVFVEILLKKLREKESSADGRSESCEQEEKTKEEAKND